MFPVLRYKAWEGFQISIDFKSVGDLRPEDCFNHSELLFVSWHDSAWQTEQTRDQNLESVLLTFKETRNLDFD